MLYAHHWSIESMELQGKFGGEQLFTSSNNSQAFG